MVTTDWCLVFCCHQTPRLMSTSVIDGNPLRVHVGLHSRHSSAALSDVCWHHADTTNKRQKACTTLGDFINHGLSQRHASLRNHSKNVPLNNSADTMFIDVRKNCNYGAAQTSAENSLVVCSLN